MERHPGCDPPPGNGERPYLMAQSSGSPVDLSTELAMDHSDPRLRWLMLWSISPTGECCCPRGSFHRQGYGVSMGQTLDCGSGPGKHPWWVKGPDGEDRGYRHGVLDAHDSQAEAEAAWGPIGGARRWGVALRDVVMLDVDSDRALLSLMRVWPSIPAEKVLGIARTPRGWHIYLDAPGWNQRALNYYMRAWLSDWHGTDESKISRRGLLLDVRTGESRYAVWPSVDRRWARPDELSGAFTAAGTGWGPVKGFIPDHPENAPWNIASSAELHTKIAELGASAPVVVPTRVDGTTDTARAWLRLKKGCEMLATRRQGRNNMLNTIAYYSGAAAIAAGAPEAEVRARLHQAARAAGLDEHEIDPTISSGLASGAKNLTTVS